MRFQRELQLAKVKIKLSELDYTFRVNFYMTANSIDSKNVLKKYTNELACQPTLSLLYLNDSAPREVVDTLPRPNMKTIMLREALPKIVEFDYEVHTTQDEKESLEYLIDTVRILMES